MTKILLSLVLAFAFLALPSPTAQTGNAGGIIVPLYTFPSASALATGGTWAQVAKSKTDNPSVKVVAIVNPASGPGTSQSASYVSGIKLLRDAGVIVIGYVHTTYGNLNPRPDIDKWKAFYTVDGIFVDEMPTSTALRQSMADLDVYIKGLGYTMSVGNPGTSVKNSYFDVKTFDAVMIYESPGLPTIASLQSYPNRRDLLSIIPYGVSTLDTAFVQSAKALVGYIYITNDVTPNPWDSLPPYYAQLVSALAGNVVPVTPATPAPATNTVPVAITPTKTATSIPSSGTIDFAVIGDYGRDNASELGVANMVKGWNPDFIITTGDNCYSSIAIDNGIGKYYSDYIGNYVGSFGAGSSVNKFFPSIGNHDYADCGGINSYLNYFTLPNNEYYYDYVKGNVHFFSLDHYSHGGTNPNGETGLWLKAGLAASTSQWNVVYFHASPYTSGLGHGNYTPMQWPFATWGADVVISGHEHSYERVFVNGIVYFVNGSGGAGLYAMGSAIPGSQIRYNADHGAQFITASNTVFNSKFYNQAGVLIDDFSISASGVTPVPVTPSVTPTRTPTRTATNIPTATRTKTPIAPTNTSVVIPPSATPSFVSVPPSATRTPTRTPTLKPTPTRTPECKNFPAHGQVVCLR